MASKRQRHSSTTRGPRDASAVANPWLRSLTTLPRSGPSLQTIEDRRAYHPNRLAPFRTARQIARVLAALPSTSRSKRSSSDREVVQFRIPKTTAVCVRRSVRKQVIHARGVAGSRVARPRRSAASRISCRRK